MGLEMKTSKTKVKTIAAIIPAFNAEAHIQFCLDSLYSQTRKFDEIVIVNDGSTDATLGILEENSSKHREIKIINQENHGPGHSRNVALEHTKSDAVIFVDSDDALVPNTVETSLKRMNDDESDVVHFAWRFYEKKQGNIDYGDINKESFYDKKLLSGNKCDEFLCLKNYFSMNNVFKTNFLDRNGIWFAEQYLYEDNIFMTRVASTAQKISIINEPLYLYNGSIEQSSSRRERDDNRHAINFLEAVSVCISTLQPRTEYSRYYLNRYLITKCIIYYQFRIPDRFKTDFVKKFVDALSGQGQFSVPSLGGRDRIVWLCLKTDIIKNKRYAAFRLLLSYKTGLAPRLRHIVGKS